jgi:hypothetical protein
MRSSRCVPYFLPFLLAGSLFAREPESLPVAGPESSPLVPVPDDAVPADASGSSVEQLLKSAERLEAAGSTDQAERVRREARERAVRENALAHKESELECLVEEIDQLRNLTGQSRTVLIRVVALEFSRAALGEQAREFDEILGRDSVSRLHKDNSAAKPLAGGSRPAAPGAGKKPIRPAAFSANRPMACGLVDEHPLSNTLVHHLLEKKLLSVLAEPTLVTVSGKSASFLSGGEFPVKLPQPDGRTTVQMVRFGVQLDARPTVLADRMIRVQAKFSLSERDFSNPTLLGGRTGSGFVDPGRQYAGGTAFRADGGSRRRRERAGPGESGTGSWNGRTGSADILGRKIRRQTGQPAGGQNDGGSRAGGSDHRGIDERPPHAPGAAADSG